MRHLQIRPPWIRHVPCDAEKTFASHFIRSERSKTTGKFVQVRERLLVEVQELDKIEITLPVNEISQVTLSKWVTCFEILSLFCPWPFRPWQPWLSLAVWRPSATNRMRWLRLQRASWERGPLWTIFTPQRSTIRCTPGGRRQVVRLRRTRFVGSTTQWSSCAVDSPVVRAVEAAKQLVFLFLRAAAEQKIHVSRRGEYIFYRFRSKICWRTDLIYGGRCSDAHKLEAKLSGHLLRRKWIEKYWLNAKQHWSWLEVSKYVLRQSTLVS